MAHIEESGKRIGRYVLEHQIGAGAMGVVYGATRDDGLQVAVKFLETDPGDEYRLRRFRDEALAGMVVEHPNVVAVIDRGVSDEGMPFIVMELARGETLSELVRRGELGIVDAIDLARQLARAVHAMHEAGIVHGDIKSDNILVELCGDHSLALKLVDLGLARVWFGEAEPQTLDVISGTPDYMAPEVVLGHGISPASDIYAVCVLLYEMVTGRTPFGGGEGTDILERQLEARATPPSSHVPELEIPEALDRVVLAGLAKSPRDRHASAATLADALAAIEDELRASGAASIKARFSCDGPTLEWTRDDRTELARGTPQARRPENHPSRKRG